LDEFTGVMLSAIYEGCVYCEHPFSINDAETIFEWMPDFAADAITMDVNEASKMAHEWVNESLSDFFWELGIDRFQ